MPHTLFPPELVTRLLLDCSSRTISNAGRGGNIMKKLLIAAAALALVSSAPTLVGQSKAAQTRSSYCDMAKSQKDPVSWNARYNCLDKTATARAEAPAPVAKTRPKNAMCDLAKSQKDPVSWNARYNCLNR
jgi:hypothetical protein